MILLTCTMHHLLSEQSSHGGSKSKVLSALKRTCKDRKDNIRRLEKFSGSHKAKVRYVSRPNPVTHIGRQTHRADSFVFDQLALTCTSCVLQQRCLRIPQHDGLVEFKSRATTRQSAEVRERGSTRTTQTGGRL
jgi:hypothetical protein